MGGGGGGGGGGGTNLSNYLPDFLAPAPIDIANLQVFLPGAVADGIAAAAETLLQTDAYLNTAATLEWVRFFDPTISGQVYAMRSSGAALAHAAGVTGQGQLIAISDSHVSPDHDVFASKSMDVRTNGPAQVVNSQGVLVNDEHGTSVGSVAAGKSEDFIGTAPDADILYGYFSDAGLAQIGELALSLGAVAWNNSWGYPTLSLTESGFNAAFAGTEGADYWEALAAYADEGVVVFAVSNNDLAENAGLMDGLPVLRNALEAGWIAVANGVPTFAAGVISSVDLLSASCLESARWCLVADGSWNAATGSANAYAFTTGSSFAAPQVSGAMALLAEAFPTLTPHELRIRLLASAADDFFTPDATVELADGFFKGYSVTYGHGFLDIAAALRPIGGTSATLADGTSLSTDSPVLRTGTGFGDAVEIGLAGVDVAVRDALRAGFVLPGEALTAGTLPGSQGGTLLVKSLRSNLAADRSRAPRALADPFAAFTGPVMTLAAADDRARATVLLPDSLSGSMGVTLTRVLGDGPTQVELGLTFARDGGGLFSLDAAQAASMASVSLGVTQRLGSTGFIALSGELGVTDLGGATALTDATSARFDAVKLVAGSSDVFARGDRLSIGLGLPVAIASGQTVMELPVYREGAALGFDSIALDLAPENRQMDLELAYQAQLAERVEMKLSLIHSENFGNRAGLSDSAGALAFTFRF